MFLGDGIHVPLARGDARSALDLRAGGYFEGGAAVEGTLTTVTTATHVIWDHLRGDGLTLDAHGAIEVRDPARETTSATSAPSGATLAWDADAIRGARGVVATTDLGAAAMPYDRAEGETSWRDGGWTIATGLRAIAPRGEDSRARARCGPRRRCGAPGRSAGPERTTRSSKGGAAGAGEDDELRARGGRGAARGSLGTVRNVVRPPRGGGRGGGRRGACGFANRVRRRRFCARSTHPAVRAGVRGQRLPTVVVGCERSLGSSPRAGDRGSAPDGARRRSARRHAGTR